MAENIFHVDQQFEQLPRWIGEDYSSVIILLDSYTKQHCYPLLQPYLPPHHLISIFPGEGHKALKACIHIWYELTRLNSDRKTLFVNLGGGVICDIGGFAASCYKRGISFINIPTTLLAMVDASVGGKTGIDFEGFKNQIGLFVEPSAVFIYPGFLQTLPQRELIAGFAEVIKHYLIADKNSFIDLVKSENALAPETWDKTVKKNILIKQSFTGRDPQEKGIRKALNYGHTIGHAVESYFLKTPDKQLLHGEAVAAGILAESFISLKTGKLSQSELTNIQQLIMHYYKLPLLDNSVVAEILELMKQDKKNRDGIFQFTLLNGIGNFSINNAVEDSLIIESLQYYNSQLQ